MRIKSLEEDGTDNGEHESPPDGGMIILYWRIGIFVDAIGNDQDSVDQKD